jgi:ornithine--oxo-acid transaminase
MDSLEVIKVTEKFSAKNYAPLPVVIEKAEGVWVYDCEGKRYLDCLSCYSALNHGHRHPRIIKALLEQASKVTLTSRAFHNTEMGYFLKELCEYSEQEMALPMNTGAEAVETALKAARKWGYEKKGIKPYEAEIIACANNFHGRTITIVSFSTEPLYKDAFGPFTPGFKVIPYNDTRALSKAITEKTVAFIVEPVQGEAGVIVPDDGYLKEVREITAKNNVLLIADEVQTGFGRTGKRFACDHEGVKPDLMALGKALGGGVYPVSAVVGRKDVLGLFRPGEHGSTFGGNPLASAVAREAIRVIVEEGLAERAFELGRYLLESLKKIKSDKVKEIRGKGLLVGIELHKEAGGARSYCEALMKRGVLCKETHEDVIRIAPPLVIEKEEIDFAVSQIEVVLS